MDWADKENRIAVIALHKCGIERARIFELLKPLNIMPVSVLPNLLIVTIDRQSVQTLIHSTTNCGQF